MTKLETWEKVVGHYGLTADDLSFILDRKYDLETVKEICEYWLFCFKHGCEFETFREADKAFKVCDYEASLFDKEVKNV